jgi:hypothetical protein
MLVLFGQNKFEDANAIASSTGRHRDWYLFHCLTSFSRRFFAMDVSRSEEFKASWSVWPIMGGLVSSVTPDPLMPSRNPACRACPIITGVSVSIFPLALFREEVHHCVFCCSFPVLCLLAAMLPCTSIAVPRTFHPPSKSANLSYTSRRDFIIFPALPRRQAHRPADLRRPASHPRPHPQLRRADRPVRSCRRHLPDRR